MSQINRYNLQAHKAGAGNQARRGNSPKAEQPTYSAFYQYDHSVIVYRHKPDDGTLDKLPQKAKPADDPRSTYFRTDGGDRFQWAVFVTELGQLIIVQRD